MGVRAGPIAALLALALLLGGDGRLGAQTISLDEQRERLRDAKAQSKAAEARSRRLETAAGNARDAAAAADAREAAIEARIKAAEADIAAARARVAIVERLLADQRALLAERQAPVARLVAALQSLARRPPMLALAQPGSTDDIVHVRAVLGTVMPAIAERTAGIRAEVSRVRELRGHAATAIASLRDSRKRLEQERLALVRLEAEHRLQSQRLERSALIESDRAIALGERARDIVDLMETMGDAAATREALETLPGPLPRPVATPSPRRERSGPPPYRLPVAGQLVTGLGEVSESGVRSRGLTFATWPGAEVVAPTGGRVVFARPFRDYGTVVILDHGGGWTTLVAGLAETRRKVGDRVERGDVIGRAPSGENPRVTVELRRQGEPMPIPPLLG